MKAEISGPALKYIRSKGKDSITITTESGNCCGPSRVTPVISLGSPDDISHFIQITCEGIKIFMPATLESLDDRGIIIKLINLALVRVLVAENIKGTY